MTIPTKKKVFNSKNVTINLPLLHEELTVLNLFRITGNGYNTVSFARKRILYFDVCT